MTKKKIPTFEPGATVYFEHPYAHRGEFVCYVPAGQPVSELIPADVPYNCCHYRVDVSKRDRVLVRFTSPTSINGVVLAETVEYVVLMLGAVRDHE